MKHLLAMALAGIMLLSFTACSSDAASPAEGESSTNPTQSVDSSSDTEWREFLQDYEAWVDEYVTLTQKYNANPTDSSLIAEYTDMASEMTEWANKADDLKADLENASAEELSEYTTELNRIAAKLAEVAQ